MRRDNIAGLILVTLAAAAAPAQTIWHVDDDCVHDPGAGTPGDPFCRIQDGINAAIGGDEVVVALGEYFEHINFNGKAITLRSTLPMVPASILGTIINGNGTGSVVSCNSGEGPDTVLSGFLITNGNSSDGGGMRNDGSSPTVSNCSFSANTAQDGGGMANQFGSNPTVTNCTFIGNTADEGGG